MLNQATKLFDDGPLVLHVGGGGDENADFGVVHGSTGGSYFRAANLENRQRIEDRARADTKTGPFTRITHPTGSMPLVRREVALRRDLQGANGLRRVTARSAWIERRVEYHGKVLFADLQLGGTFTDTSQIIADAGIRHRAQ